MKRPPRCGAVAGLVPPFSGWNNALLAPGYNVAGLYQLSKGGSLEWHYDQGCIYGDKHAEECYLRDYYSKIQAPEICAVFSSSLTRALGV